MKSKTDQVISRPIVAIAAIALAGLLSYADMFAGGFKTLDDQAMILNDPQIRQLSHWPAVFKNSYFGDGTYYRPLLKVSYMIDYAAYGEAAFFFYLTNLLIHLGVAALVFFFLKEIYDTGPVPLAAALLFVLHPIHWVAVSMITGRSSSIEALFFMMCVTFFALYCKGKGRGVSLALSLAAFALALLSRETAIMIPAVLVCYLYFFPMPGKRFKGAGVLIAYILIAAAYVLIRQILGITKLFVPRTLAETALEVLTFLRALITHLRSFFLPYDLHFDRTRAVFERFADPQLLLTLLFWAAVAVILFTIRRRLSSRSRFFLCWIFLTLLPVSQLPARILVQPGFITTGEHHLYLPSIGVFALFASFAAWVYARGLVAKGIFKFAMLGLIFCLVSITMKQVRITADEIALHQQALNHEPYNFRLRHSYIAALIKHGRFPELETEYRRMLEADGRNVGARIGLGKALIDQGRLREGIAEYEKIATAGEYEALLTENLRLARQLLETKREP